MAAFSQAGFGAGGSLVLINDRSMTLCIHIVRYIGIAAGTGIGGVALIVAGGIGNNLVVIVVGVFPSGFGQFPILGADGNLCTGLAGCQHTANIVYRSPDAFPSAQHLHATGGLNFQIAVASTEGLAVNQVGNIRVTGHNDGTVAVQLCSCISFNSNLFSHSQGHVSRDHVSYAGLQSGIGSDLTADKQGHDVAGNGVIQSLCQICIQFFIDLCNRDQLVDHFLSNQNLTANATVAAFSQAGFGAGGSLVCVNDSSVAVGRNSFLSLEHSTANVTVRAFSLTGVLAIGSDSLVNNGSVTGSGNSLGVGLAAVAGVGLDAFGLTARSSGDFTLVPGMAVGGNGLLSLDHSAANVTVRAFGLTGILAVRSNSLVNDNIMNNSIAVNSGFNPRHSTTGVSGLTLRQSNFQLQEVVAGNIDIKLAGNIAINRTGNSQQLILFYIIGCSLAAVNTEHSTHIGTGFRITVDTNDRVEPVAQALNIQSYIGVWLSAAGQMQVQEGSTLVVTISNSGVTQLDILGSSIVKYTVHTNRTRIGRTALGHDIGSHNLAGVGQLHGLCTLAVAYIVGVAFLVRGKALGGRIAIAVNASISPGNSAGAVCGEAIGHAGNQLNVIVAGDIHIELCNDVGTNAVSHSQLGEAGGRVVLAAPDFEGDLVVTNIEVGDIGAGAANYGIEAVNVQTADIISNVTVRHVAGIGVNAQALVELDTVDTQSDVGGLVGNAVGQSTGAIGIQSGRNLLTGSIACSTAIEAKQVAVVVLVSHDLAVVLVDHVGSVAVQIGQIVQVQSILLLASLNSTLSLCAQQCQLLSSGSAVAGVEASIRPCNFTAIIGGLACFFIVISALQLENQLNVIIASNIYIKLCNQIGSYSLSIGQLNKFSVSSILGIGTAPHFKYAVNTALALVCQIPAGTANHSVETVDIQASGAVDHVAFCAANRVRHHADTLVILNAIQA